MKHLLKTTLIAAIFLGLVSSLVLPKAQAQTVPSFPNCPNPQGSVSVSYSEGTHGIVGNTETHTGSDTVYALSDSTTMQCFCADDGNGVQTNWWEVSSLTDSQVQVLKNQGWYVVPDGALWGLASGQWLAFNSSYSCPGGTGGSGGQTLGASTSDPSDTGQVLGLAATGNLPTVYALGLIAIASFGISYWLRKYPR